MLKPQQGRPQGLKPTISLRIDASLEGPLFRGRASGGCPPPRCACTKLSDNVAGERHARVLAAWSLKSRTHTATWKRKRVWRRGSKRHELTYRYGSLRRRGGRRRSLQHRGRAALQRRVKRSWRIGALAPVALRPAGMRNSPTKTHTPPHPSPTAPELDSCGRTLYACQNPPHHESDDS